MNETDKILAALVVVMVAGFKEIIRLWDGDDGKAIKRFDDNVGNSLNDIKKWNP